MRFLAAVLTVALLFGAVGVVTVSASQVDHAAVNAPTGSTTCAGDVDTSVSHAGRPLRAAIPASSFVRGVSRRSRVRGDRGGRATVTVLVVETRDDIAEWLQTLLEARGNATVTLLESGRGAAPDAVLEQIGRGWVRVGSTDVPLTRRETELIGHLAANRDRVVPRDELLSRFWGYETRSLDVHLARTAPRSSGA